MYFILCTDNLMYYCSTVVVSLCQGCVVGVSMFVSLSKFTMFCLSDIQLIIVLHNNSTVLLQ